MKQKKKKEEKDPIKYMCIMKQKKEKEKEMIELNNLGEEKRTCSFQFRHP